MSATHLQDAPFSYVYGSFSALSLLSSVSVFSSIFQSFYPHSGKYYIILVWVFSFIVALCLFYPLVINCNRCKFICQAFYKAAPIPLWKRGRVVWVSIPDSENPNQLSRWRDASLKKVAWRIMRWCQRQFLLTVDLSCWFVGNKILFQIALEPRRKNWISLGVESACFVCLGTQRSYQHKVEKCSMPFDEVAAAQAARTHTHTHTHGTHTHTRLSLKAAWRVSEWESAPRFSHHSSL